MKFKTSTLIWTFLWSLFMGVTAISIGFGAVFPAMNLISKPFVCPGGNMTVDEQVYRPYPGKTVTTLTWYCTDLQSGRKTEIGLFPMSISAGLIYGFLLFIVIFIGMWVNAKRSASNNPMGLGYGEKGIAELQRQEQESIRNALSAHRNNFNESRIQAKNTESASARMKELKDLRASNLISESEYEQKRAEILKEL